MSLLKEKWMLPLGRKMLKDEEVVLIRFQTDSGDTEKNWASSDWWAICKPNRHPFWGYEVVGRCDLRYGYNRQLYYGGNIGYRVFEEFRGNRMAEKATRLLLRYAREKQMPYIIITCNPDNVPSRKTLEKLQNEFGGEMLRIEDLPPDNDMYQRGERQKCIFFFPMREGLPRPNANTFPY